jgi:hypothetical protein
MHAPITVNYVPDGEDWTVTVTDEEQTESATASGLIAARDQADQIVEKMGPSQTSRTVVHLLEGDAVAFTNTYLQARLGLTPAAAPGSGSDATAPAPRSEEAPAQPAAAPAPAPQTAEPEPETIPAAEVPGPELAPQTAQATPTAAPLTPSEDQPDSSDESAELVNVPAQGANQVS